MLSQGAGGQVETEGSGGGWGGNSCRCLLAQEGHFGTGRSALRLRSGQALCHTILGRTPNPSTDPTTPAMTACASGAVCDMMRVHLPSISRRFSYEKTLRVHRCDFPSDPRIRACGGSGETAPRLQDLAPKEERELA